MDVLTAIHTRRSQAILTEPGPRQDELAEIVAAGMAAPDHGRLRPWRFITLAGRAKDAFAETVDRARSDAKEGTPGREWRRLGRAPVVVVTVCVAGEDDRIPRSERLAATAAATQNMLLTATALGYGSMWRTGGPATDPLVKHVLGLGEADDIVAFVYLGSVGEDRDHRPKPRPDIPRERLAWAWPRGR